MSKHLADTERIYGIISENTLMYSHMVKIYAQAIRAANKPVVDTQLIADIERHVADHIADVMATPQKAANFIMSIVTQAAMLSLAIEDLEGGL